MGCLIVVFVLAIQPVNLQLADSSHMPIQERSHGSAQAYPIVIVHGPVRDTTLETFLFGRGASEHVAATIDSLLARCPQLRSLLLREILIPTTGEAFLQPRSARDEFLRQVQQMSRLSRFEQMSLAAKRYQDLYQHSAENRLLVPQLDVIGTISWILLELSQLLK